MLFWSLGWGGRRQVVAGSLGCEVKRLGLGSNGFQLFFFVGGRGGRSTKGAWFLGVDLRRMMDWL